MLSFVRFSVALRRARAAARAEDWHAASVYYRKVLKRHPSAYSIWVQYAHVLKETGQIEQAEIAYRRAVLKAPEIELGYRELALFLRRLGRTEEARTLAAAGLVVDPSAELLVRELRELGVEGDRLNDYSKLGALVVRVMRARAKTSRGKSLGLLRARSAARKGHWPTAAKRYARYLRARPDDNMARIQYAHALRQSGETDLAARYYRQAVARDPLMADAHLELGHALMRSNDHDQALVAFASAIKLDPSSSEARRGLGELNVREQVIDSLAQMTWLRPLEFGPIGAGVRLEEEVARPRFRVESVPTNIFGRERQIWISLAHRLIT